MRSATLQAIEALIQLDLLWLTLLHATWLGFAAAAVAAGFETFTPRRARLRRSTLLVVCLASVPLIAPILAAIQLRTPSPICPTPNPLVQFEVLPGNSNALAAMAEPHRTITSQTYQYFSSYFQIYKYYKGSTGAVLDMLRPVVIPLWLLGLAAGLARLAIGLHGAHKLQRHSVTAPDELLQRLRRLSRRIRLSAAPRLALHPHLAEPCLCGFWHPVVLLPTSWLVDAAPETIDAALAHELAHARRRDPWLNLAQRIVEALLFFHPGMLWLSRSLRAQRELEADRLSIRVTGNPLALARVLATLTHRRIAPRLVGATLGGDRSHLLARIQEILGMTPPQPRPTRWPLATLPLAMALALVATSASRSQSHTPPPPFKLSPIAVATSSEHRPPLINANPLRHPLDPELAQTSAQTKPSEPNSAISYEIRVLDVTANPTELPTIQSKSARIVLDASGLEGLVVEDQATREFVVSLQENDRAVITMAPRIIAFEGESAGVGLGNPRAKASDSDSLQLTTTGVRNGKGTRMKVDIRSRSAAPVDPTQPRRPDARYSATTDVPEAHTLIVALGKHLRRDKQGTRASTRIITITPRHDVINIASSPTPHPSAEKPDHRPEESKERRNTDPFDTPPSQTLPQ